MVHAKARILLVDDTPLLEATQHHLVGAGHEVLAARTGQEALELVRDIHPDIVLVNVILPDTKGVEVCRRIREETALDDVAVLLISSRQTKTGNPPHGFGAGADGYIRRPIPPRELVARVEAIVRLQQTAAELQRERDLVTEVMETSPVGMLVVSAEGEITYANASAQELLGPVRRVMTDEEGAPGSWQVTYLDGRPVATRDLIHQQVKRRKSRVMNVRHVLTWPDGRQRTISVSGAPLLTSDKEVSAVIIVIEDITTQVAREARIAQMNTSLDTIRSINQMLIRVDNRQDLIDGVCNLLVRGDVAACSWIILTDSEGEPTSAATAGTRLSSQELVARFGKAASTSERAGPHASHVDAISSEKAWLQTPVEREGRRMLAVALQYQEHQHGILGVTLSDTTKASLETRLLLEEVASDIGFAIHALDADAEIETRRAREQAVQMRLRRLVRLGDAIAAAPTVDELCHRAVERGIRELGFERLSIWLRDENGNDSLRGTWGVDRNGRIHDERHRRSPLDLDDLLAWNRKRATHELHLDNVPLDDGEGGVAGIGTRTRALMWDGEDFIGLLSTDNLLTGNPISSEAQDILGLYATIIANTIIRKRAAEALREREQFYRTLFETTGTATMVLGDDMRPTTVNAEAEAIFGYSASELSKMRVAEMVVPEDRELVETRHRARRTDPDGTPGHYEVRMTTKSGETRNIMIDVNMIPGTSNSIASFSDITTQKDAIRQLGRRAAQQSALNAVITQTTKAESLSGLLESTVRRTVEALDVSAACAWIADIVVSVGIADKLLIPRCQASESPSDDREPIIVHDWAQATESNSDEAGTLASTCRATTGLKMIKLGLRSSLCIPILKADTNERIGRIMVADTRPRNWASSEIKLLEALERQVSAAAERLGLLQRVQREARRLQTVIDAVPEGVVLLSADHTILLANPVAAEHLTLICGAVPGDRLTHLGDHDIADLLVPPSQESHHTLAAQGHVFELLAQPLAHTHSLEGWVIVNRDVTEERLRERQQRQQEQLAAVGRLASGIAHDFNNIIAIIVLYAQMAERQLGLPPRTREQLRVINEQAHRATDLIGQILDFSRSAPLERQPMDLIPYIKEIIKLWERTLPENIAIDFTYQPGDYTVVADPTRIQQTLMNLATNARDALPDGGQIRIGLDVRDINGAEMPSSDLATGRWVEMSFTDTGVGIPPDVLPYVFEPFFTTKETGSGLGLAQVHGIVKQHEGEVTIASEPGTGTTVTIYLPAARRRVEGGDSAQPTQGVTGGERELILVVEDNPHTSAALLAALDGLNYRTLAATNGREALDIIDARGDEIDMILTDAIMPELGAQGLVAALTARGDTHPVLVLSGYVEPEEQDQLRASPNFVAWLTKPVDLGNLATAIRLALERR